MDNEELLFKVAEYGKEIGSIKHRLDNLEEFNATIQELALSVRELSINVQNMSTEQKRLFKRIENIEEKPAKRLDTIITVIITALVSGAITYFISKIR